MKAVILAGGLGTRLRPFTNKIPKVMVDIEGKPLLYYHIKHLREHGVKDIWISIHHFHETIKKYFGDGSNLGLKIKYSYDKKLPGTSGVLKNQKSGISEDFKKNEFIVVYGDNLTNFNYSKLIEFHKQNNALISMGLYESYEPWTMGNVEIDRDGRVLNFIEKPEKEKVKSNLVWAGIIVCKPEVSKFIPSKKESDFGFDIFPKLLKLGKPLFALNPGSYVQDCGTFERLSKARNDFAAGRCKFYFHID
jgi:mannose-1-phosphate guanylyltransferase/phosphomannomutase